MLVINFLSTLIILNSSFGAIIVVNSGESIQEKVNKANLDDTISIKEGEYYENIVINKTVTLKGDKKPLIKGIHKGPTISISASNVKLKGLHIVGSNSSNSSTGVSISSERNNISGNEISGSFYGIRLQNNGGNIIMNNLIITSGCGIFGKASKENIIEQNRIESYIGITISDFSDENRIGNNTMENDKIGVGIYNSKSNIVRHNDITTKDCCIEANSLINDVYDNSFNCLDRVCEVKFNEPPPIFIRDRRKVLQENLRGV